MGIYQYKRSNSVASIAAILFFNISYANPPTLWKCNTRLEDSLNKIITK